MQTISEIPNIAVRRHWIFVTCCLVLTLANYQILQQLYRFSLSHEFASMIPIIPFMSGALVWRIRNRIFERIDRSPIIGGILLMGGLCLRILARNDLSKEAVAIVCLIYGSFLLIYGSTAFRNAFFPLLILLFLIPIPEAWLEKVIEMLRSGSAQGVAMLFSLTGTPYHREGTTFLLPRIAIEIAPECSSIRSSLALLITCLLAGHLMLRTTSRKFILALVAVPMAMVKNAIRIATLSWLAIHIDKGYLSGDLHHKGGIVFFMMTLLLMGPVLWILRKSEKTSQISGISTE
jgi:exosortase